MVTISLCMIVKNEEKVLKRCLDSVKDLMDEIIIVDTGSTDCTKAECDYIYTADADEVLNQENYEKFRTLKETLLPEIEIVQMYYGNQLAQGTVYNYDRELRPKLFKRLRTFQWIEPVHETVRLLPVVFDSDIEIIHLPETNHGGRDLAIFEKIVHRGEKLSDRLVNMYARELLISGKADELQRADAYFTQIADDGRTAPEQRN